MKRLIAIVVGVIAALWVAGIANGATPMTVTVGSAAPIVDSVVVNDANPTSGSTTQITVTAIISDTNGVSDISIVNASFTVGTPANGQNITRLNRSICTDVETDTIQCVATYNMQFYDPAMTYTARVYAQDASGASNIMTDDFVYSSLKSLSLDATGIDFGTLAVEATGYVNGDTDMGTPSAPTIRNLGNAILDVGMQGADLTGPDTITVDNAKYRFGSGSYISLTTGNVVNDIDLAAGASLTNKIDFSLYVPIGSLPGSYTGQVIVTAE